VASPSELGRRLISQGVVRPELVVLDPPGLDLLPGIVEREVPAALDQAEQAKAVTILTGRPRKFSAGFDLNVMKRGGTKAIGMLRSGYALTARVMAYPHPVIAGCNGHSFAMGVFLMLSADYIVGSRGDFKIAANEVAIGMTMPRVAAAVLRNRLTPAAFQRAVTLAEFFDPESAMAVGFFDELVEPRELMSRATALAKQFQELDMHAHEASKRQERKALVRKIRRNVPLDLVSAALQGVRRSKR